MNWYDETAKLLSDVSNEGVDHDLRWRLGACIHEARFLNDTVRQERRAAWDQYYAALAGYGPESAARGADAMLAERDLRWKKPRE